MSGFFLGKKTEKKGKPRPSPSNHYAMSLIPTPPPRVVLTHGYFLADDPKEQAIMKPYPPLGILYISAFLEKNGVTNEVFDTTFSSKNALREYLLASRPPFVALYVNLMTKLNVLDTVRWLRSRPEFGHTRIVLGGPDVTHNVDDYLAAGADFIVLGEGEQTMLDLTAPPSPPDGGELALGLEVPLAPLSGLEKIPGLVWAVSPPSGGRGGLPFREKIRDLDTLPFPNRLKINLQLYLDAWKRAHGHSAVSISTQRGCPYTCRWCSTAVYGQSYRRRSPANVVDEIVWLQQHYDFDLIWFVDDVFTVSHRWLREFCEALENRSVRVRFECITRADRLNEEVIGLLRRAGCFRVWIGAESGSQRILDAMDRRVDATQVRDMIRAAKRADIQTGTFIMLGYPGETEADIRATVEHLKACDPDLFTITVAYPIKGTALYEEVEATQTTDLVWAESTDRDRDFRRTYPRRYYDFAVRWTVNSVHLHKTRLAGRAFSARGFVFWAKTWAARAGMWWHEG
jgi:anaerobic magnesium-protoporphyrin IX monomethyl ester cyclase